MISSDAPLTVQDCLAVKPRPRIVFMPTKNNQGFDGSTVGNNVITLDPRSRVPMAKILLHELIHICRPLWSERRTLMEESRLWKVATWREKAELFKALGRAHIWTGEGSVPEEVEDHIGTE